MSGLGLNGALAMGAQSLSNQQLGVTVAGRNIANVSTPGASRQRLNLSSNISLVDGTYQVGTGSVVQNIQALRDSMLDASVVQQSSASGYYDTLLSQSTLAQSALGESISTTATTQSTGTQQALNDFFDAWQALSTSPTNSTVRQEVLSTAQVLVSDLNTANANLLQQQANIATDASNTTDSINDLAANIAQLNLQITRTEALSGSGTANDLRDQRQLALEKLGNMVDITTTTAANGMVNVSLTADTSIVLVNGSTSGATATTSTLSSAYNAASNPPVTVSYTNSSGTTVIPNAVASTMTGQLGADLEVANVVIGSPASVGNTGMLGQLDQVAINLVSKVNTIQQAGYDNNGNAATTQPFFTAAVTGAGNIAIDPTLAADPNLIAASNSSGKLDGSNAAAMANLRSNATIIPAYQTLVADVGQTISQAKTQQATQEVLSKAIIAQRDSVSGISLDDETVSLMAYQTAYQASAKFINVIDQMLTTVLQMGA